MCSNCSAVHQTVLHGALPRKIIAALFTFQYYPAISPVSVPTTRYSDTVIPSCSANSDRLTLRGLSRLCTHLQNKK